MEEVIKGLKEISTQMQEQINIKFKEIQEEIDKKFEEQQKEIDKKFEKQQEEIDKKFEERFETQNQELAIELRNIVEYICNRNDKKINIIEQKMDKEMENNKVAHDGYNAKMYKIELSQSNLESKIYDLENPKKITNNV